METTKKIIRKAALTTTNKVSATLIGKIYKQWQEKKLFSSLLLALLGFAMHVKGQTFNVTIDATALRHQRSTIVGVSNCQERTVTQVFNLAAGTYSFEVCGTSNSVSFDVDGVGSKQRSATYGNGADPRCERDQVERRRLVGVLDGAA